MKKKERALIERALDGALPPSDWAALAPEVAARLEEERALRATLRQAVYHQAEGAHDPFLADRVMRAVRRSAERAAAPAAELASALAVAFRRVSLVGLVLVALLSAYNLLFSPDYLTERSAVEQVLGLPPVTLETADALDLSENLQILDP
jgi:hypothetical protein